MIGWFSNSFYKKIITPFLHCKIDVELTSIIIILMQLFFLSYQRALFCNALVIIIQLNTTHKIIIQKKTNSMH